MNLKMNTSIIMSTMRRTMTVTNTMNMNTTMSTTMSTGSMSMAIATTIIIITGRVRLRNMVSRRSFIIVAGRSTSTSSISSSMQSGPAM